MTLIDRAVENRTAILTIADQASDLESAAAAVAQLLDVSTSEARSVLDAPLAKFIRLEAAGGAGQAAAVPKDKESGAEPEVELREFRGTEEDVSFYQEFAADPTARHKADWPTERVSKEVLEGQSRIELDDAAWFIVQTGPTRVGFIFGELNGQDVVVNLWIHPEQRARGYAWASLRQARKELAALFPGASLTLRTPLRRDAQ